MPTQSRKYRGYDSQKLVAEHLKSAFPYAEPTGAGRQGRDILSTPGVYFEIKARSGFSPTEALKQTVSNAVEVGDIPIIVMRMNGQGEKNVGKWVALTELDFMVQLIREAGYGT